MTWYMMMNMLPWHAKIIISPLGYEKARCSARICGQQKPLFSRPMPSGRETAGGGRKRLLFAQGRTRDDRSRGNERFLKNGDPIVTQRYSKYYKSSRTTAPFTKFQARFFSLIVDWDPMWFFFFWNSKNFPFSSPHEKERFLKAGETELTDGRNRTFYVKDELNNIGKKWNHRLEMLDSTRWRVYLAFRDVVEIDQSRQVYT